MKAGEVKAGRKFLGLTQSQLAPLLGYSHPVRVSEIERGARDIGAASALLLTAYLAGYRPPDWPAEKGE